jgi:hypothetical protein
MAATKAEATRDSWGAGRGRRRGRRREGGGRVRIESRFNSKRIEGLRGDAAGPAAARASP